MKPSPRIIFTPITGDPNGMTGYIVRSRKTGLILGNVWHTWDPYSITTKTGWCAYGKGGHIYPTRREAGMALTRLGT